jgi:hypothetical protein
MFEAIHGYDVNVDVEAMGDKDVEFHGQDVNVEAMGDDENVELHGDDVDVEAMMSAMML